MRIEITADELISALLSPANTCPISILDSCGVSNLGSRLLIAGVDPVEVHSIRSDDAVEMLNEFDSLLSKGLAAIFTLSYEFGRKIQGLGPVTGDCEPDIFISLYDVLAIHDYEKRSTLLAGNVGKYPAITKRLLALPLISSRSDHEIIDFRSNFTRSEYLSSIEEIKERIREGDTYQTNLTQRLSARIPTSLSPGQVFANVRKNHPAPFAAFIERGESTVISASPERFFRVNGDFITTSPIKGTRPRSADQKKDQLLKRELLSSLKDRAENTMIVDLLRNDLGRVCKYGTVQVEKLCDLEEHPSLFHLVSTISGRLRSKTRPSDLLKALFPCGSITGAPKISTMHIIDTIEPSQRGLSMGSIGYYIPANTFGSPETLDLNVAIRTMVVREDIARFNVGGGIVIESQPGAEYAESLIKASALLNAINGRLVA